MANTVREREREREKRKWQKKLKKVAECVATEAY
jgi:hypothetical protein